MDYIDIDQGLNINIIYLGLISISQAPISICNMQYKYCFSRPQYQYCISPQYAILNKKVQQASISILYQPPMYNIKLIFFSRHQYQISILYQPSMCNIKRISFSRHQYQYWISPQCAICNINIVSAGLNINIVSALV